MANTKVTKAVLADDAVGLAQLDITNDPSDGQALTYDGNSTNLQWASVGVSGIDSSADATAITIDSSENVQFSGNVGIGVAPTHNFNLQASGTVEARFRSTDGDCSLQISSDTDEGQDSILEFTSGTSGRGRIVYDHNPTAASQKMIFKTGDVAVDAMTIDGVGRVLIGQESGDAFNDDSMLRIQRTGDRVFQQFKCDADQNVQILFGDVDDDVECSIQYHPSDKDLRFTTGNNAEALRIDNSQRLLIGTTNSSSTATDTGLVLTDGHILSRSSAQAGIFKRTSSNGIIFIFRNTADTRVGTIETSASSTSYNTSSDYRLKENVSYDWDATTRLKQLKPARFNWIEDETNTVVDGFLAHEVSDIVPEAISGEKDAVDEDGNPDYQGIDQSKLVPLLVKTIQELEARIETLESN